MLGVSEVLSDPGLFGPGSVTWRVHADQILWVGGLRALYLQALQPETVRGVFTHSGYRDDPWGRLLRTADYVGVVTYGTTARAEAAGARVRAVHSRLGLTDPHLLRWVHCCEVGSFLEAYRRAGAALGGRPRRPAGDGRQRAAHVGARGAEERAAGRPAHQHPVPAAGGSVAGLRKRSAQNSTAAARQLQVRTRRQPRIPRATRASMSRVAVIMQRRLPA
jgi:hypothetical protein